MQRLFLLTELWIIVSIIITIIIIHIFLFLYLLILKIKLKYVCILGESRASLTEGYPHTAHK